MGDSRYLVKFQGKGVCAKGCKFAFKTSANGDDLEIVDPEVIGGCPGQCKVLAMALNGMTVKDAVSKFGDITCGKKPTSCAQEVVHAIEEQANELR